VVFKDLPDRSTPLKSDTLNVAFQGAYTNASEAEASAAEAAGYAQQAAVPYQRLIATATVPGEDVRVTGVSGNWQTLVTTAPALFDGGPVVVEFNAEYINNVPDTTVNTNGLWFDLAVDGVRMERIGGYGTHSTDNNFSSIYLRDILDAAPRLIPAGMHTVGIVVSKWAANQDGYIVNTPGFGGNGWGMPIRLTVSKFG